MPKIQQESEQAKRYMLQTLKIADNIELVALTQDNVAKVEAMIQNECRISECS